MYPIKAWSAKFGRNFISHKVTTHQRQLQCKGSYKQNNKSPSRFLWIFISSFYIFSPLRSTRTYHNTLLQDTYAEGETTLWEWCWPWDSELSQAEYKWGADYLMEVYMVYPPGILTEVEEPGSSSSCIPELCRHKHTHTHKQHKISKEYYKMDTGHCDLVLFNVTSAMSLMIFHKKVLLQFHDISQTLRFLSTKLII